MATTQTAVREITSSSTSEVCKCGDRDCLGHEVVDGAILFPGFTSEAVLQKSPYKVISFNCSVTDAFLPWSPKVESTARPESSPSHQD